RLLSVRLRQTSSGLRRCAGHGRLHLLPPARAPVVRTSGAWPFRVPRSFRSSIVRPFAALSPLLWPRLTPRSAARRPVTLPGQRPCWAYKRDAGRRVRPAIRGPAFGDYWPELSTRTIAPPRP